MFLVCESMDYLLLQMLCASLVILDFRYIYTGAVYM